MHIHNRFTRKPIGCHELQVKLQFMVGTIPTLIPNEQKWALSVVHGMQFLLVKSLRGSSMQNCRGSDWLLYLKVSCSTITPRGDAAWADEAFGNSFHSHALDYSETNSSRAIVLVF